MRKLITAVALLIAATGAYLVPSVASARPNFVYSYQAVGADPLYCTGGAGSAAVKSYAIDPANTVTVNIKFNLNGSQYSNNDQTLTAGDEVGFSESLGTKTVTSAYILYTWPDGSNFKRNFAALTCP